MGSRSPEPVSYLCLDYGVLKLILLSSSMRSSTVLVISLKGVAHEIIKNLVLAGIGKLIVMDNEVVTEEDLGTGFLFREEDGAVGKAVCLCFSLPCVAKSSSTRS